MLISSKGRYALRIMLELAKDQEREAEATDATEVYTPLRELAERQGLSEKYLESILKGLVDGELVQGRRGRYGGYRLTRPAEDITAYDVLLLAEPSMAPVSCLELEEEASCAQRERCMAFPLWEELDQHIASFLKQHHLSELIEHEI